MAKVHLFPLINQVYDDTRLPLQYPGNSQPVAASQVTLLTLLAYINANLDFSTQQTLQGGAQTMQVPAGKWLIGIAVYSSGEIQVTCGLTNGGNELIYEGFVTSGETNTYGTLLYTGNSAKTLYFNLEASATVTLLYI